MQAPYRSFLAALAWLVAGGAGLAQTGHGAVAPGSAGGWKSHGPFLVCNDPGSNGGCVVETGVRVRAGNRVEVRARGRVNFGGGISAGTAGAAASVLLGVPAPPPPGRIGDAVRDPDGEAATDPACPAPGLRKNSLLVLVAGAGLQPKGAKAGKLYQGGKSTSFTPGEDGEVVLMANDARPEDNRAVCEGGICGWEVTLDVYDTPAAGPKPVAGPPPARAQPPAGPDAPATRTPVSGSQPPQVATPVTNPGSASQPAQVPPLDTVPGRAGTLVAVPGSALPSRPPLPAAGGASHPDDVQGSRDPPLVPRALGAVVRTYDVKRLDSYLLPLGPTRGPEFARSQKVRGKVTHLVYELAADCSVLDAGEHYAAVLRQAGFQALFACEDAGCGPDYGLNDGLRHPYWSPSYGERQITAVLRRGGVNAYASVHVQGDSPASARAWVTVVEGEPKAAEGGSGVQERPQSATAGMGASASQTSGSTSLASGSPVSGIGAAAPPSSGSTPAASQSPASGVGAGAPPGSGIPAQQPPAAGVGAAAQGGQPSGSGIGASASSPPALTPEQRTALEQCVNGKLLGAAGLAGTSAATQAQEARVACQRELQLTGAAR